MSRRIWTKALKRERILSVLGKGRAIRNPQARNGNYAGLAAVLERDEMELVRHYIERREAGERDNFCGLAAFAEAIRTLATAVGWGSVA